MIESLENILQILVVTCCLVIAVIRGIARKSRLWLLLTLFYGSWLLGDLYWVAFLVFFSKTPQISLVSDLSWYASFVFLYMLLRDVSPPGKDGAAKKLRWLGPIFALGMALFFIQWGEILGNLIYAGLMGLLLYAAISRITERRCVCLASMILIFCLLEYGLWVASCFWDSDSVANPYYWFDLLLSICFPFFLPATKKAM